MQLLVRTFKLGGTQLRLRSLFQPCPGSSPPAGAVNWKRTPRLCSGQKHSTGEDAHGSRQEEGHRAVVVGGWWLRCGQKEGVQSSKERSQGE